MWWTFLGVEGGRSPTAASEVARVGTGLIDDVPASVRLKVRREWIAVGYVNLSLEIELLLGKAIAPSRDLIEVSLL
jgi:hypothetical protein